MLNRAAGRFRRRRRIVTSPPALKQSYAPLPSAHVAHMPAMRLQTIEESETLTIFTGKHTHALKGRDEQAQEATQIRWHADSRGGACPARKPPLPWRGRRMPTVGIPRVHARWRPADDTRMPPPDGSEPPSWLPVAGQTDEHGARSVHLRHAAAVFEELLHAPGNRLGCSKRPFPTTRSPEWPSGWDSSAAAIASSRASYLPRRRCRTKRYRLHHLRSTRRAALVFGDVNLPGKPQGQRPRGSSHGRHAPAAPA